MSFLLKPSSVSVVNDCRSVPKKYRWNIFKSFTHWMSFLVEHKWDLFFSPNCYFCNHRLSSTCWKSLNYHLFKFDWFSLRFYYQLGHHNIVRHRFRRNFSWIMSDLRFYWRFQWYFVENNIFHQSKQPQ